MVEEGAALNSRTRSGETPLAGQAGNLKWSLAHCEGANVNQEALDKTTPLMTAAFAGRVDLMRALLDGSAEIDRRDQVFKTAMIYAAAEGRVKRNLLLDRG
jgi:ankyrin repeat protein